MSCVEEILRSLRESRKDETIFHYNGAEYENYFGKYTKNHQPISKEEFHSARRSLMSQDYEEGSLTKELHIPYKELANQIEKLYNFTDSIEYDKEYEVTRDVREGHLPRFSPYDKESRVSQIMKDTGLSLGEAEEVNDIILEYTSTNNYSRFNEEDRILLDKFIESSPIYAPPPVYRGIGFREKLGDKNSLDYYYELSNLGEGSLISFRDYTSFSSNPDIAIEFAYIHGDYLVYLVNTKNLTGVSIDHLSSIDYKEDELIYKSDVLMKVLSIQVDNNTTYIHVEELPLNETEVDEDTFEISGHGSMFLN